MSNININQFAQTPVRGQLDLQIAKSGVLSGEISVNEAGSIEAGDPVKLDPAATGAVPQFLAAGPTDDAIGYLVYDVKRTTLVARDAAQVSYFGGPVMFMEAETALNPGVQVEQNANGKVQVLNTGKLRGLTLDPVAIGGLFRVIILNSLSFVDS